MQLVHNWWGIGVVNTKDKGNPLALDIHNAILTWIDKEPYLEKFNGEDDPIISIQL